MTAIDDLSTVGDEYSSKAYSSISVEERIGYLHGKLDARQTFFREQMAEWKSRVDQLEHENRTWKATVQQNQEQVAALHEQVTELKSHVLASKKLLEHDDDNNSNLQHVTIKASSSTKMALAELKSREARSEHEILTLKTAMEQLVQEKEELAAKFHEQNTDLKANVAKLEEENTSLKASKVEQQVARHDKNPQTGSWSHCIASIEQKKLVLAAANLSKASPLRSDLPRQCFQNLHRSMFGKALLPPFLRAVLAIK
jgi:chromosome segregation ATPase